jgi:D-arabinose 1-dehydrogenase-like Zn-dependent alcohol dehydrogenase
MQARTAPASAAAAVAIDAGETEMRDIPLPQLGVEDGLLKVEITGVCGSDWGYYQNLPRARGPLILGHETVGVIDRAGTGAQKRWGLKEGDRVALEEYLPCGHCGFCRSGEFRLCEATDWRSGGLRYGTTPVSTPPGLWGGYAQYHLPTCRRNMRRWLCRSPTASSGPTCRAAPGPPISC